MRLDIWPVAYRPSGVIRRPYHPTPPRRKIGKVRVGCCGERWWGYRRVQVFFRRSYPSFSLPSTTIVPLLPVPPPHPNPPHPTPPHHIPPLLILGAGTLGGAAWGGMGSICLIDSHCDMPHFPPALPVILSPTSNQPPPGKRRRNWATNEAEPCREASAGIP